MWLKPYKQEFWRRRHLHHGLSVGTSATALITSWNSTITVPDTACCHDCRTNIFWNALLRVPAARSSTQLTNNWTSGICTWSMVARDSICSRSYSIWLSKQHRGTALKMQMCNSTNHVPSMASLHVPICKYSAACVCEINNFLGGQPNF